MCRSKIFLISISLLLVIVCRPAVAQDDDMKSFDMKKIEKKAYEKYITQNNHKDYRFTDDTTIAADTIIAGNVIVVSGDLRVEGQIDGDVLVIWGNAEMQPGSVVNGNVTCVNGRIRQEAKSEVHGNQIETKAKNLVRMEDEETDFDDEASRDDFRFDNFMNRHARAYSTLPLNEIDDTILMRYNRVQGPFLGVSIPKSIRGKYNIFNMHGFGGYGFKEKKWRYELGIDRWLFNQKNYRFELGGKFYDLTDTKDTWIINPTENSLAAFFIHEDFQDFYRRKGFEFHTSQNLTIFFKGTLTYRSDKYESLDKNTDWALFGGKKKFRANPIIDNGTMNSLIGELYFDTRDNKDLPRSGWFGLFSAENSNSQLKSDFSFVQYCFELRRYQRLDRYERIDLRLKAVTSQGEVPKQKRYQLGGIGTLNGLRYKELKGDASNFGGDRLLLANIEYNISPRLFRTNLGFIDNLRYILFFEIGNVWQRADVSTDDAWNKGYSHLRWHDFKSDFGIAFTTWSEKFRVSVARRTDTGKDPFVLTFRITKPF